MKTIKVPLSVAGIDNAIRELERYQNWLKTRANILLDSPRLIMPKTLCKTFRLTAFDSDGKETELLSSDNNLRRSYHIDIDMTVTALRLTPLENYGGTQSTKIFSFDFKD